MFNNIKSHLGYELFPGWFNRFPFTILASATNHSMHHTQYNGNYGLFFRFWDWVCGTELPTTMQTFDEIHAHRDQQIIDNTTYKPLTIERIVHETADVVSIYLSSTDPQFYHYQAGQHLTIMMHLKGADQQRCFSLSSAPGIDEYLRITVKRNGIVSQHFIHDAKVGDTIMALYPVGELMLPRISSPSYTFVA
jgi:ring-1,2-phenylacetyl-CoA epoxidase subunit PaaE